MPDNRPTRSIHLPDGKQSAYRRGRARLHKSFSGRFSPQALNLPVELSDSIRAISTFLRSLRSTGVTRLLCYYGRSDSCRAIVSRVASVGLLRVAPTRTYGRAVWMWSAQHHLVPSRFLLSRQVSLLTALDLLTIPSSTTKLPFPHRGFRTLPQPDRLPRRSPGQTSEGRWDCRHAVRGSPLASRLPDWLGRIRFVILRTGRSPPVASHLSSRRRSYFRLQVRNVNLVGTFTPPINRLQRRTSMALRAVTAATRARLRCVGRGHAGTPRRGAVDEVYFRNQVSGRIRGQNSAALSYRLLYLSSPKRYRQRYLRGQETNKGITPHLT